MRALAGIVACEIHPLNNPRTLNHVRKTYGVDEAGIKAWYQHWIADGFGMIEGFLASEGKAGTYCLGERVTMADCCLVPQVFNAQRYDCDLAPYPTAMRIFEACMKLDGVVGSKPEQGRVVVLAPRILLNLTPVPADLSHPCLSRRHTPSVVLPYGKTYKATWHSARGAAL